MQNRGAIVAAELSRPCDQRAVARNFVVLDGPGGSDEGRIQYLQSSTSPAASLASSKETVNGRAIHALGFDAMHFEDFFETDDLVLGLCQVCIEPISPDRLPVAAFFRQRDLHEVR